MSRVDEIIAERLDKTFAAIAQAFRTAADKGSAVALEELADYMNGCDAVEEGDAEAYAEWVAKGKP